MKSHLSCLCFFVFLFYSFCCLGQDAKFKWAKTSDGYATNIAYAMAVDASGNVYTSGYFCGGTDFDPGSGVCYLQSLSIQDVFITKFDSTGKFIWAKNMGGMASDLAQSMVVDNAGNIILTGFYEFDFNDVDSSGAVQLNMMGNGYTDVFVVKLKPDGSLIWAKFFGAEGYETGMAVSCDMQNNIYIAGNFEDTVDFDPGPGVYQRVSNGVSDVYVMKLDAAGNFAWVRTFGGASDDICSSVDFDNGSIVVTGMYNGTSDFDPGSGVYNMTATGSWEIFVMKLDPAQNFAWARSLGAGGEPWAGQATVDLNGNTYAIGTYSGTGDFDPGAVVCNLTAPNNSEQYLFKLDLLGNFVWAKSFGNAEGTFGSSITSDKNGDVYLTGGFANHADLDPGTASISIWAMSAYDDAFVIKINPAGDAIWAKRMGGVCGAAQGEEIAVDRFGNIFTSGGFYGAVDFDPNGTVSVLSCDYTPNYHYYVQKLQQEENKKTGAQNLTKQAGALSVFPNPGTGLFYLEAGEEHGIIRVEDLQGRLILQQESVAGKNTIDISNEAEQVYVVKLKYVDQTERVEKILKR